MHGYRYQILCTMTHPTTTSTSSLIHYSFCVVQMTWTRLRRFPFLQIRDQSVERPAEAVSDPHEHGQSAGCSSSTHRGRWQLTDLLRKRIQPARFWLVLFVTVLYLKNDYICILTGCVFVLFCVVELGVCYFVLILFVIDHTSSHQCLSHPLQRQTL